VDGDPVQEGCGTMWALHARTRIIVAGVEASENLGSREGRIQYGFSRERRRARGCTVIPENARAWALQARLVGQSTNRSYFCGYRNKSATPGECDRKNHLILKHKHVWHCQNNMDYLNKRYEGSNTEVCNDR
jgi:hypothetical protein